MTKKKKTIKEKFEELSIDIKSENESAKEYLQNVIDDLNKSGTPVETKPLKGKKYGLPELVDNLKDEDNSNNIFDSIKQWHEIAGINVSTENTLEELKAQMSIVSDEIDETYNAYSNFNYHSNRRYIGLSDDAKVNEYKAELLDGLGDTIWTCVGMILRLGINPNDVMQRILDSNNSKFIPIGIANENHINIIEQTVEKYKKQDIEVEHHVDNGYLVFRNKETKKILKPVTFVEPKLEELL